VFNVLSFDDVLDRMEQGPICSEHDFDLRILHPKLQEVIRQHDIKFDSDSPVPCDDALADEVFKAALDLYSHTGTLCTDAHRRILFNEDEIRDSLRAAPTRLSFGEGKDQRVMVYRAIEDSQEPFCISTPIGQPVSEENYLPVVISYVQNPFADAAGVPSLTTIRGRTVKSRSPTEFEAAIWAVRCFRTAGIIVGRPGIGTHNLVSTAESTAAIIAAMNTEFGARKTDGVLVGALPELKIDMERLNKTACFLRTGHIIESLAGPLRGGLSGGVEGTAIVTVANLFQGRLVARGDCYIYFPTDLMYACNSTREMLWLLSVVGQAISRNTHALKMSAPYQAAGPCTEMVAYESAATCLASVTSGADIDYGSVAKNKYFDYCSGLEAELALEISRKATGMKRKDANIITKELLKKYESKIHEAPLGKRFQECYDVEKVLPRKDYVELHSKVRKELVSIGLDITT